MPLSRSQNRGFRIFPWLSILFFNHRLTYSLVITFISIKSIQTISASASLGGIGSIIHTPGVYYGETVTTFIILFIAIERMFTYWFNQDP